MAESTHHSPAAARLCRAAARLCRSVASGPAPWPELRAHTQLASTGALRAERVRLQQELEQQYQQQEKQEAIKEKARRGSYS